MRDNFERKEIIFLGCDILCDSANESVGMFAKGRTSANNIKSFELMKDSD